VDDNLGWFALQALQRSSDNAEDSSANVQQGVGAEAWEGKNATSPGQRRRATGSGGEGSGQAGGGVDDASRKAAESPMEGGGPRGRGKKAGRGGKQVQARRSLPLHKLCVVAYEMGDLEGRVWAIDQGGGCKMGG